MNIPGWSLNNNEVARFFFQQAAESYAAKTGDPRNVGVIGAAIFNEKDPTPDYMRGVVLGDRGGFTLPEGPASPVFQSFYCNTVGSPVPISDSTCTVSPDSATYDSNPVERERGVEKRTKGKIDVASEIGTGFGKAQTFRVQDVTFERVSPTPDETMEITYDSRKGLEKRGVDLNYKPTVTRPNPFPGDNHCKPPLGWEG